MQTVTHQFGMGHTIEAIIKLHNRKYDLTKTELAHLLNLYNELNNHSVPKLGDTVLIPILYIPQALNDHL
jgi:hypothetical protein